MPIKLGPSPKANKTVKHFIPLWYNNLELTMDWNFQANEDHADEVMRAVSSKPLRTTSHESSNMSTIDEGTDCCASPRMLLGRRLGLGPLPIIEYEPHDGMRILISADVEICADMGIGLQKGVPGARSCDGWAAAAAAAATAAAEEAAAAEAADWCDRRGIGKEGGRTGVHLEGAGAGAGVEGEGAGVRRGADIEEGGRRARTLRAEEGGRGGRAGGAWVSGAWVSGHVGRRRWWRWWRACKEGV
ncbi:hypothetical protein OF83DRAFT_1086550 [Amylostereum chailletii]|nr:hypothetical protein OF83DRAFT_1086550 [Amylostereum chailletii]